MSVDDLAAAMSQLAGAIHDRIADTGPKLTFPKSEDTKVYIARLAKLGVITAEEVADLNSLWDEVTNEEAPEPGARVTTAGNRILARNNSSQLAVTIAGIAIASVARRAKSTAFISWSTVGADVAGAVVGGVAGAVAGEMIGGKLIGTGAAVAGGIAGAVVVGGLASSE